ncbi:MAG: phosphohistidine phosphatase [Planctomycetota bacterium]|jgi:phosphohistidine phosphatase
MKKLTLIRHAKSSWKHPGLEDDHDRTLNKRGVRDATELSRRFHVHGSRLDLIFSSTAMRARTTALAFLDTLGLADDHLRFDERLYLASKEALVGVISGFPNEESEIAIVGHNPGMTALINQLSDLGLENMPTCGVVELTYEIDSWADLPGARPVSNWHDYPQRTWGN